MNSPVARHDARFMSKMITRTLMSCLSILVLSGGARAEPVTAGTLAIGAAKAAVVNTVAKNFEGANREKSTVDKITKAVTGVSVDAIRKNGILGGKKSFLRRPFG